jgi:hypothetical protein
MGKDADTLGCNRLASPRILLNVSANSPSRLIDCKEIRYVVEPPSSVDTDAAEDAYEPGVQFHIRVGPVPHSADGETGIQASRCGRGGSTSRQMDTSGS